MEKARSAFKILTGSPAGRPRQDNIRIDLKEIGINKRNWVYSAKNTDFCKTLANVALNLWSELVVTFAMLCYHPH